MAQKRDLTLSTYFTPLLLPQETYGQSAQSIRDGKLVIRFVSRYYETSQTPINSPNDVGFVIDENTAKGKITIRRHFFYLFSLLQFSS
jgi:hypothetical protein